MAAARSKAECRLHKVSDCQLWCALCSSSGHRLSRSCLSEHSCVLGAAHARVYVACVQVHHRLFVCSNAHEQKSNVQGNTTVVNITPGSERLSATGLKVSPAGL